MANLTWFKSSEAELNNAYRKTGHEADRFPYATPIIYQGNTGRFSGDDGFFNWLSGRRYLFLLLETQRGEMGCAGLHYLGGGLKCYSFRSLRKTATRGDVIRDFEEMLKIINVGRAEFFESLREIKFENATEVKNGKPIEIPSPLKLTLDGLIEFLSPSDFGEAEKKLIQNHKLKKEEAEMKKREQVELAKKAVKKE
ncbi:MAG: hypothetical protein AABW58_00740 [Nanoarchaeota archaeon]